MTTTATPETPTLRLEPRALARILDEGYGPGAWHGPDLKAAVADVTSEVAFRRPAPGRHSIAEIVLHHCWYVRSVIAQLSGRSPDPFPLAGEDWFPVDAGNGPSWDEIRSLLDDHQKNLASVVDELVDGRAALPSETEPLALVLGITCHAVYHAGQIQLVRRLLAG